jgi:hypothetical protein
MERRTVVVRLQPGDAAALWATVTLRHGAQSGTVELHSGHREGEWAYDVTDPERPGVAYAVEYTWGYARDMSVRGEWPEDVLVLPLPNTPPDGCSFPFRRQL